MISINLLPWREGLRKELLKEFFFVLWGGAAVIAGCMLIFHFFIHSKIDAQQGINNYLQQEIVLLDEKIQDINNLQQEKNIFTQRMAVIKMLQSTGLKVVHIFDELGSMLPDGIYLTRMKRVGNKVSIYGRSEYNSEISVLMRNIEASSWLAHPILEEIKSPNRKNIMRLKIKKKDLINDFKLTLEQVDPLDES